MLVYKAMFRDVPGGVHAEVLDFPGVISFGEDLAAARTNLRGALVDMAETNLMRNEPLPVPDPSKSDLDADLEEPIYLVLTAAFRIATVPEEVA